MASTISQHYICNQNSVNYQILNPIDRAPNPVVTWKIIKQLYFKQNIQVILSAKCEKNIHVYEL